MARSSIYADRPRYWGEATSFIHQHRGMARLPGQRFRLWRALGLALVLTAGWLFALQGVGTFWAYLLSFAQQLLHLPGQTIVVYQPLFPGVVLTIPYLDVTASGPDATLWWITTAGAILGFLLTYFVPYKMVPTLYFLRAALLIQATAIVYFAFWPEAFPYDLAQYLRGMTTASLCVLSLVPLVLGFTYYILDFNLGQKLLLTACIMGHMTVLIPLQYLIHGYLIHHFSMMFMPLLYLLFGLPLNVLVFIALYGWGMSWAGRSTTQATTPLPPPLEADPPPAQALQPG